MYDLRDTTKNPSHLQDEMGERRERSTILGTPDQKEIDRTKAIVPKRRVQSNVNNVPQVAVQRRGGDGAGPAWKSLTDTMKIAIVLQVMVNSANAADYLDLDDEEMNNVNPVLAVEKGREDQYELDAHGLTEAMHRHSEGLTTKAEKEAEMEVVYALNKKHLAEAAPAGYLVQRRDVEVAQKFVRARAQDVRTCKQIVEALSMHVGKDYSYETIGALEVEEDEEDDDDVLEQAQGVGTISLGRRI